MPVFRPTFSQRLDQVAVEVAVGAIVLGVVGIDGAVPVGKAVVMLAGRQDVLGAGLLEQRRPCVGIPLGGRVHRQEILVAELGGRPDMLRVPLHHGGIAAVHVADIPLAGVGRDGVDAPVHHDAELAVAKPLRVLVILLNRIPGWLERAGWRRRETGQRSSNQLR